MTREEIIKYAEDLLTKAKVGFEPDEEWWDCGNLDDANAHGLNEGWIMGLECVLDKLKQK